MSGLLSVEMYGVMQPQERWWWDPEKNDAALRQFNSYEPKDHLKKRIGLFRRCASSAHAFAFRFRHAPFQECVVQSIPTVLVLGHAKSTVREYGPFLVSRTLP